MGSHGMRTHLASLTIPPQLGRTDSQNPRDENARICNIVIASYNRLGDRSLDARVSRTIELLREHC